MICNEDMELCNQYHPDNGMLAMIIVSGCVYGAEKRAAPDDSARRVMLKRMKPIPQHTIKGIDEDGNLFDLAVSTTGNTFQIKMPSTFAMRPAIHFMLDTFFHGQTPSAVNISATNSHCMLNLRAPYAINIFRLREHFETHADLGIVERVCSSPRHLAAEILYELCAQWGAPGKKVAFVISRHTIKIMGAKNMHVIEAYAGFMRRVIAASGCVVLGDTFVENADHRVIFSTRGGLADSAHIDRVAEHVRAHAEETHEMRETPRARVRGERSRAIVGRVTWN